MIAALLKVAAVASLMASGNSGILFVEGYHPDFAQFAPDTFFSTVIDFSAQQVAYQPSDFASYRNGQPYPRSVMRGGGHGDIKGRWLSRGGTNSPDDGFWAGGFKLENGGTSGRVSYRSASVNYKTGSYSSEVPENRRAEFMQYLANAADIPMVDDFGRRAFPRQNDVDQQYSSNLCPDHAFCAKQI